MGGVGGVGWGGWGGPYDFSVTPVQTRSQELEVRSLEFRVRSLSGLRLDFRLTIMYCFAVRFHQDNKRGVMLSNSPSPLPLSLLRC